MDIRPSNTTGYYTAEACSLEQFASLLDRETDPYNLPFAAEICKNVPVYNMAALTEKLADDGLRRAMMAEWAQVLHTGAGVFLLRAACPQTRVLDEVTEIFDAIIKAEKTGKGAGADHFAAAGHNDRIWNSLQKLCEADPDVFLRYHGNAAIDAACEAWLGPNYQMTTQVNVVHPGGAAQQAHRDYHLGFQTTELSAQYPAHVHDLSPLMTLQGGIAHGDTPLESGPTKLLPFSQLYRPGYVAWRRDDFRDYFETHHVQLPLQKGDAVFFNPALFHAAGANTSKGIHRMVNLLQVSSPFGRTMETVDRNTMCAVAFEPLKRLVAAGGLQGRALDAAIASTAEGYSFPTNLDTDPPSGGLAPQSQAALLREAVSQDWSEARFRKTLDEQARRRQS